MTRAQDTAAHAAFVAAGWVVERNRAHKHPRYALPDTTWRGRVGDLYVMLYRLDSAQMARERHYLRPGEVGTLGDVLEGLRVAEEGP